MDPSAWVSQFKSLSQHDHHRLLSSQTTYLPPPLDHSAMGMSYRQYLAGARIYGCSTCKTHLATIHSMLSRVSPGRFLARMRFTYPTTTILGFQRPTRQGISLRGSVRSHLVGLSTRIEAHTVCARRVNVVEGKPCDRQMTTGNHTVRDIYCVKCGVTLGWKYVRASGLVNWSQTLLMK